MSADLFDPDAPASVQAGRGYPYTTVGDWVLLNADLSDRAIRVYAVLRMHANRREECWPSQRSIADLLGLKKPDTIPGAIAELVGIGAVEVRTVKATTGRRNIYVVHEAPPESFLGPVSQQEYRKARETV